MPQAGTTIHLCGVYADKLKSDGTVDYAAYGDCFADGENAVTGGLVGKADNTKVTLSFAALPALKGNTGALLIGQATGCEISSSYANCDTLSSRCSYFVQGSRNTVEHCYAVGNTESRDLFVFCGSGNTVTDSYYAVSHRLFAQNFAENRDLAPTQFSYTAQDGSWLTVTQEQLQSAVQPDGWAAGAWTSMIAPLSHPYREYLDGKAFPFPAIGELDHYGLVAGQRGNGGSQNRYDPARR